MERKRNQNKRNTQQSETPPVGGKRNISHNGMKTPGTCATRCHYNENNFDGEDNLFSKLCRTHCRILLVNIIRSASFSGPIVGSCWRR
jgi:hypothetical protein